MFAKEVTADGTVQSYREPSAPQGALLQQPSQGACTLGRGPRHRSWGAERETETALNHFPSPCLRFFPPLLRGACKLCVALQPSRRHTRTAKHNTAVIWRGGARSLNANINNSNEGCNPVSSLRKQILQLRAAA